MKILDRLGSTDGRVFDIEKTDAGFEIREACDYYFVVTLTADELRQLGQELIDIANG